jgi:ABC-type uncharacterized transport system permease subunit
MSLVLLGLLVISAMVYGGVAVYFEVSFWIGIIAGIVIMVLIILYHRFYVE